VLSWFSKKSGLFDFIRGLSIRSILAFLFHELRKREYSRPTILPISVRERLLIIQEIIRRGSLTLFLAYSARSHSLYSLASETSHDYLASSLFQCQSDVNFMLRSFWSPSSLISLPRKNWLFDNYLLSSDYFCKNCFFHGKVKRILTNSPADFRTTATPYSFLWASYCPGPTYWSRERSNTATTDNERE